MADDPIRRHDLLRVTPEGWRATLAISPVLEQLPDEPRHLVGTWAEKAWPLIARRPCERDVGGVAVGLPLPPSMGKLRLGFTLSADVISERLPAVPLSEALAAAPDDHRGQLEAVIALGLRLSLTPSVFGALLWQHLTSLAYLRPGSDIDLLWPMADDRPLADLLAGLLALDAAGPARLDGEILLPGGEGVNWRELHGVHGQPAGQVLVKSMDRAELRCAQRLFA